MAKLPLKEKPEVPESTRGRRWASLPAAAKYAGVKSPRTITNWISSGLINGYQMNARVIRVDLNEIDAAFGGAV
jgi:hypothetical protein